MANKRTSRSTKSNESSRPEAPAAAPQAILSAVPASCDPSTSGATATTRTATGSAARNRSARKISQNPARPLEPARDEAPLVGRSEHVAAVRPEPEGAPARVPSHDEIARRAYEIYLRRGARPGCSVQDWLEAVRELSAPTRAA